MAVSIKLKLNKNRLLKTNQYPLIVQVIRNRRKKQFSAHCYLSEAEYDEQSEKVLYINGVNTRKEVKEVNCKLSELKEQVRDLLEKLAEKNPCYTADDFSEFYKQSNSMSDFFFFMGEQIKRKIGMGKIGISKAYTSTLSSLRKFDSAEHLEYGQINSAYVERYHLHLLKNGTDVNTIAFYMRNFQAVYNRQKKERGDMSTMNPFLDIPKSTRKTRKRALSKATISDIDQMDLSHSPLKERARDLFIFSFNTMGMSFVDIMNLTKKNLADNGDMLVYYRAKTSQLIKVPLNDRAKEILYCYYDDESDYLFSFMESEDATAHYANYRSELGRTNRNLKLIGSALGIQTPLTTYVARHSWASAANSTGHAVTLISSGLGHTSLKTTQIYLDDFKIDTIKQMNDSVTRL